MTSQNVIPVVDARGHTPAWVAQAEPARMADLLAAARRFYSMPMLVAGDALSRHWLKRNHNPYLREIDETAKILGGPGAHVLNMSYEWSCTSGTRPAEGGGQMLVRVLDWQLDGLGRNLCAIRRSGPAGDWLDLGWPGSSGTVTAVATGRFAAAINQPPLQETWGGRAVKGISQSAAAGLDWLGSRKERWQSRDLPPVHLLRKVCDEAQDWTEARRMLCETPVSTPVLFTLAGPHTGEGCVIERGQTSFRLREAGPSVAVANHWCDMPLGGIPRGSNSLERQQTLEMGLAGDPWDRNWLREPILNLDTRVIVIADPQTGQVHAQGWEASGPATEWLSVSA